MKERSSLGNSKAKGSKSRNPVAAEHYLQKAYGNQHLQNQLASSVELQHYLSSENDSTIASIPTGNKLPFFSSTFAQETTLHHSLINGYNIASLLSENNLLDREIRLGQEDMTEIYQPYDDNARKPPGYTIGSTPSNLQPFGSRPLPVLSEWKTKDMINQRRRLAGEGEPLGNEYRNENSPVGAVLADTKLHVNDASNELTKLLDARAATIGNDIYISSDQYRPGSSDYEKLLSHEITHILQTSGKEGEGALIGRPMSPYEQEAANAELAVQNEKMITVSPDSSAPFVQRLPRPFPNNASAVVPTIDVEPVNAAGRRLAGNAANRLSGAGNIWDNAHMPLELYAAIRGLSNAEPHYASPERVYDPGFLYANFGISFRMDLLEDNRVPVGGGAPATIGRTGETVTTSTSSRSVENSGGISGTAGKEKEGGVTASAGTKGTQTESSEVKSGGSNTANMQSSTQVYQSNLYIRLTVYVRAFDIFTEYTTWSGTEVVEAGTATYSLPTLLPPPPTR